MQLQYQCDPRQNPFREMTKFSQRMQEISRNLGQLSLTTCPSVQSHLKFDRGIDQATLIIKSACISFIWFLVLEKQSNQCCCCNNALHVSGKQNLHCCTLAWVTFSCSMFSFFSCISIKQATIFREKLTTEKQVPLRWFETINQTTMSLYRVCWPRRVWWG